jgi:peptidyl-prolyl cis-trans isomerase C
MVKEFDNVVFSANLNEVQGPVKTQFGYHLLEVTSRTD